MAGTGVLATILLFSTVFFVLITGEAVPHGNVERGFSVVALPTAAGVRQRFAGRYPTGPRAEDGWVGNVVEDDTDLLE